MTTTATVPPQHNNAPKGVPIPTAPTTYGFQVFNPAAKFPAFLLGKREPPPGAPPAYGWDPFNFDGVDHFTSEAPTQKRRAEGIWRVAHAFAHGEAVRSRVFPDLTGAEALLADWKQALDDDSAVNAERAHRAEVAKWEARKGERRAEAPGYYYKRGLPLRHVKAWKMGRGEWKPGTLYEVGERVTVEARVYLCLKAGKTGATPPSAEGFKVTDGGAEWQRMSAQEAVAETLDQLALPLMERVRPILVLTGTAGTCKSGGAVVAVMDYALAACDSADAKPEPSTPAYGSPRFAPSRSGGYRVTLASIFDGAPSVVFWNARERARAGIYGEEAATSIQAAKDADILIVDEVGGEFASENGPWLGVLEEVINARYEDGGVTILTANLEPENLAGRLGERIADRIREAGRVVNCGIASVRRTLGSAH